MPCQLLFAPLQGYTHAIYRQAHHLMVGGVDAYYTPFVRWEHGGMPTKNLRDIHPDNNQGIPTVPQVIARDRDEFLHLCDLLQEMGWQRIDLNMGCPFPLQVHARRGSGLLPHPNFVEEITREMRYRPEVTFSVKMRLGWDDPSEALRLLPLLNDTPLTHITLHPRIGRQQYKGIPDMGHFARFMAACTHPMVYNGDLTTVEQIDTLIARFPKLRGVMIGRGLLANPTLAWQWRHHEATSPLETTLRMHEHIFRQAYQTLCSEAQILAYMHSFWEYPAPLMDKKLHKRLIKSGNIRNYIAAINDLQQSL